MIRHYFCMQYAELFNEYDLFLNLPFYPWNIHVNGQYLNCDSTNDLSNIFLFSKLVRFDNIAKTDSFLPPFFA